MEKIKKFFSEKFKKASPFTILVGVLLFVYSLFLFILLLWGVSNSLKSVSEFRTNPMFLTKSSRGSGRGTTIQRYLTNSK